TDGNDLFPTQNRQVDTCRPLAAVEDGQVEFIKSQVDDVVGDFQAQLKSGDILLHTSETWHEPLIGNAARAGDGQLAWAGPCAHTLCHRRDFSQNPRNVGCVSFTDLR